MALSASGVVMVKLIAERCRTSGMQERSVEDEILEVSCARAFELVYVLAEGLNNKKRPAYCSDIHVNFA